MKRWLTWAAAAALSVSILATSVSAAPVVQKSELTLADSMELNAAYLGGEKTSKEHVLIYESGGDIRPVVVYGNTLYGRSTMDYMASYIRSQGYTPVAAVNAAFFDLSNGLPIGMVVTDGYLRASGAGTAVGVEADGTIRIGSPELKVEAVWDSNTVLIHYNQLLVEGNGMVLYSRDYDTKTKGAQTGYHVVLEADRGTLTLGGSITAKVAEIVEDTASCAIPEDGFVLSVAEEAGEYYRKAIRSLEKGDTVTLRTSIDRSWQNVEYAVGGGDMLVEGGNALSSFTLDSADRQAPRTALGLKANGDVVVYTVDRSDVSAGMTLAELARRMEELGCVTAVNLDGGGSTCVGVTRPGETDFTTVNEPSDGQQRACANYIFFVRPTTAAGTAAKLYVYPYDMAVLPGGQVTLTAKAADRNYMATALPGAVQWSTNNGTVSGGVFTASRPGTATVAAQSGGLTGVAVIQVVETPTTLELLREDQEVTELLVECGTGVDLTARATYLGTELAAQDSSFTWSVTGNVGSVNENGLFTAGDAEATGSLTVSCGEKQVTIPVETRINPMTDLEGHWAREYISNLYFKDVLKGSYDQNGNMVYRPDASMTRQEFIVALIRWLQVNVEDYAKVELPFADNGDIADWAVDAMKAAYELGYLTGSQIGGKLYAEAADTITREAAMTILARTQGVSSGSDVLKDFADEGKVSAWARPYLTAMVERGVINGMDGRLQPQGNVTRAQVAKMLFAMD